LTEWLIWYNFHKFINVLAIFKNLMMNLTDKWKFRDKFAYLLKENLSTCHPLLRPITLPKSIKRLKILVFYPQEVNKINIDRLIYNDLTSRLSCHFRHYNASFASFYTNNTIEY
jgi:hypothetical protein